jgi:2'-5' RNA ligase
MPRLFFALWPDNATRTMMTARRDEIVLRYGARALLPDNLHMTLVFVGHAEELKVPSLLVCGDRVRAPGFSLTLDAVSHFRKTHLAWLGGTEVPAQLIHLQERLHQEVRAGGFPLDDRSFTPHVSVARDCRYFPPPTPIAPIEWRVESFVLVDSRPSPTGPLYRVLKFWQLDH